MASKRTAFAVVKFQVEGFHRWPDAAGHRSYLADRHRHLFYVEASISLAHNEREIEFHDFLDFCKRMFLGGELENQSCETMANQLISRIETQWPDRKIKIGIFEDNEVGAYVQNY